MTILVDIGDRLYDYTDEEAAAEAVSIFQEQNGLDDATVVAVWTNAADPRRVALEKCIFDAVDANGSSKRAAENVPGAVSLTIETERA